MENNKELRIAAVLRAYIGTSGTSTGKLATDIGVHRASLMRIVEGSTVGIPPLTIAKIMYWLLSVDAEVQSTKIVNIPVEVDTSTPDVAIAHNVTTKKRRNTRRRKEQLNERMRNLVNIPDKKND